MSSRNNTNDNEEFPDELELQQPQKPQQKQQRPQKVKKIQEPMESGGEHDSDDDVSGGDGSSHSSDQEESEEDENNLYDVMTDFFTNDNGENVATVLTNIQASLDQHAKCILKLTKVIQEIAGGKSHK